VADGSEPNDINDSERKVLSLMGGVQIGFDELQLISGLTTSELSSILTALELHGLVKQSAGNTYTPIR
jgi:predicted Rossmann fold nucleotide-binding protein DprA/Smf involved in DNA uptake